MKTQLKGTVPLNKAKRLGNGAVFLGALIAKFDIAHAYRNAAVHLSQRF